MANPFEAGRAVGTNFAQSMRNVRDESAIERILSEAQETGDPAVLQQSIGKILSQVSPERQQMAVAYLQNAYQNIIEKQNQKKQVEAATRGGYDPYAPPQVQAQQVKEAGKQRYLQSIPGMGGMSSASMQQPVESFSPQAQTGLDSMTDQQLEYLTGAPYKELSEPAKNILTRRKEDKKLEYEKEKQKRNEEIKFHQETQKYDEELTKSTQVAKKQLDAINDIEKAVKSGKVKPTSWTNIFKGFGTIGDKLAEAVQNQDEATILASIPQLLEGWKQVFGVRLSDADLRVLQDKLPSIGKSPEANLAITRIMKKYGEIALLRQQIGKEIKDKNNGLRPLGYADKIEARFDEMTAPVKIISPNSGKIIEIPAYKVSEAILAGAKLASEGSQP